MSEVTDIFVQYMP